MNPNIEQLFEQNSPHLWRLCQSLCYSHEESEDLFQETFARACAKFHTYRPEGDFRKWIFAICYNLHKNHYRKARSRPVLAEFQTDQQQEAGLNAAAESPTATDQVEVYLDIQKALDSLPYPYRAVVVFYYFDDLSVNEISQIMKIPVHTVKNRLHRARRQLKERLVDYE